MGRLYSLRPHRHFQDCGTARFGLSWSESWPYLGRYVGDQAYLFALRLLQGARLTGVEGRFRQAGFGMRPILERLECPTHDDLYR